MTTTLGLPVALGLGAVLGLALALATPTVLRRLPEPAGAQSDTDDPKLPYASLATRGFGCLVGVLVGVAILLPATTLPVAVLPVWLVLGTLGLLLAAIDARTTWLPLPLTQVTWAAMAGALVLVAALAGWTAALRGVGGFLVAGGLFGVIWLVARGGFGFGDVRYAPLVGAATAVTSWSLLAWALLLGSVTGALVGVIRLTRGRRGAFPYAPSILSGAYLAVTAAWLTT